MCPDLLRCLILARYMPNQGQTLVSYSLAKRTKYKGQSIKIQTEKSHKDIQINTIHKDRSLTLFSGPKEKELGPFSIS